MTTKQNRRPSIRTGRYYVTATVPGISGFQRWNEREYRVVGHKRAAGRDRLDVLGELVRSGASYRLEDGHTPEFQPVVTESEALTWLSFNPYGAIALVDDACPLHTQH